MTHDQLGNEFDEALQRYLDLGESAAIIVREMKKTPNSEVRRKLTHELRNADKKRIEILNQIGRPCALFVNHFGQRHSEVDHPFLFRSLRIVRTLAVPAVLQVVVKLNVVTLTR